MSITTHVLDTSRGAPAQHVPVTLEQQQGAHFAPLGQGVTDADGRLRTLLPPGHVVTPGVYRITFDTATYFRAMSTHGFYPIVTVLFEITDATAHHHVPLLINPFGYSTYRGS